MPLLKGSHTRAHTPKQGPSLPWPQCGFVLPAKSLLFRHAFVYIHFPVLCEPSLSATALSQTIFHRVFQLLVQTAHVRFHERKWVHTRLSEKDRTQRHTRRNRGCFGWGAIITLDTSCTFTNIPGPGIRTAYFAAFGAWSWVLSKNAESLGTAMRLCASLSRGVAAPLGCVIFLLLSKLRLVRPALRAFPRVRDEGWYHYPQRTLRAAETPDGRLSKRLTCRFLRPGSLH